MDFDWRFDNNSSFMGRGSFPRKNMDDPPVVPPPADNPSWWCIFLWPGACAGVGMPDWLQEALDYITDFVGYCFDCTSEIFTYIYDTLKNKFGKNDPVLPLEPSATCWILGTATILIVGAAAGAILYFGGEPILQTIQWVFGSAWSFLTSFASYFLSFTGGLTTVIKNLFSWLYETCVYLASITYSSPQIWVLDMITALVWGALQVVIELLGADVAFKSTKFYDVWKILDFPIAWILDEIAGLTGGKGILYWLAQAVAFPFQAGILLLSFLVGLVCYLAEEIVDILKDKTSGEENQEK